MSSPRAATFVATSTSMRELRKRSITRLRACCGIAPWMESTRMPRSLSRVPSRDTWCRVRPKTIVGVPRVSSRMCCTAARRSTSGTIQTS